MDKWAERERDDWAKMDEEFAEYFDRDESLARGQSTLGVHAAEERMRMDMERRKRAAASAATLAAAGSTATESASSTTAS